MPPNPPTDAATTRLRALVRRERRAGVDLLVRMLTWMRPLAASTQPMDRSWVDDLAARRPWNVLFRVLRFRARRRADSLERGITVVIVNWNTQPIVADVLDAVRQYSSPATRILVCDNGSVDGSKRYLRERADVEVVALPRNVGHGAALDISMCHVSTDVAVTIDSDAIPLGHGWLDRVVEPIRVRGMTLSGVRSSRGFVHPVYLAIDVRKFLERRLSFQIHLKPGVTGPTGHWGVDAWDTAELLAQALLSDEIEFVSDDLIYHHGGVTLNAQGTVTTEVLASWRAACSKRGLDFLRTPRA